MSNQLLRVRDWDILYENNRTRHLKATAWVPVPNKHDNDGYTQLVDHEHGTAHFGCWVATLQVASRCHPRGTLVRDRRHTTHGGEPRQNDTLSRSHV